MEPAKQIRIIRFRTQDRGVLKGHGCLGFRRCGAHLPPGAPLLASTSPRIMSPALSASGKHTCTSRLVGVCCAGGTEQRLKATVCWAHLATNSSRERPPFHHFKHA